MPVELIIMVLPENVVAPVWVPEKVAELIVELKVPAVTDPTVVIFCITPAGRDVLKLAALLLPTKIVAAAGVAEVSAPVVLPSSTAPSGNVPVPVPPLPTGAGELTVAIVPSPVTCDDVILPVDISPAVDTTKIFDPLYFNVNGV